MTEIAPDVPRGDAGGVAANIVVPAIRAALRPTVSVDEKATNEARRVEGEHVAEIERSFVQGRLFKVVRS